MKGSIEEGRRHMPQQRRQYTEEFKREAIRLAREVGLAPPRLPAT